MNNKARDDIHHDLIYKVIRYDDGRESLVTETPEAKLMVEHENTLAIEEEYTSVEPKKVKGKYKIEQSIKKINLKDKT